MMTIPDPGVAAILGAAGFDFVIIDCEHGPFSPDSSRSCVDALAATPARAVIRVAAADPVLARQALDLGADGVLVPMVDDATSARAAVEACRYPPAGSRGIGAGHATRYGAELDRYLAEANQRIAVLLTIETRAGVENVDAITAVDGVDGIVIGPTDLAADLGVLGAEDDGPLRAAVSRVAEAALGAGIPVGIGCGPEDVSAHGEAGMTLFVCYSDGPALGKSASAAAALAARSWERSR